MKDESQRGDHGRAKRRQQQLKRTERQLKRQGTERKGRDKRKSGPSFHTVITLSGPS